MSVLLYHFVNTKNARTQATSMYMHGTMNYDATPSLIRKQRTNRTLKDKNHLCAKTKLIREPNTIHTQTKILTHICIGKQIHDNFALPPESSEPLMKDDQTAREASKNWPSVHIIRF